MCGGRDVSTFPFAQISLPYALAARLSMGNADLAAYRMERRRDPLLRAAMDKVTLAIDPLMAPTDEPFVCIQTTDGRRREIQVVTPLGSPANPVSDDYLSKVRSLAGLSLNDAETERLISGVLQIWDDDDVLWVGNALSSQKPRPRVLD